MYFFASQIQMTLKTLIESTSLTKYYGEMPLFEDISFSITEGQKVALIARNGTGKSTLLNILSSRESADAGSVLLHPGITIGYLTQEPEFEDEHTILEAIFRVDNPLAKTVKAYEQALLSEDTKLLQFAMDEMERNKAWDYEVRAKQILTNLKITRFKQKIKELSGGQKKRLALAAVLISEPELLIFDEPTNHLDLDMIEWLEDYLKRAKCTLFMVTHDRYFLDRVCNEIVELENNTIFTYKGNYSYFLEKRDERMELRRLEVEKAKNLLRKEEEWMRRMPKARSTKAKYRIDKFYDLKDTASQNLRDQSVQFNVGTSRLGTKILEMKNVSKSFDELVLLKDFNYKFNRLEKVGVVGENGTGKSTFVNILTGNLAPDSGTLDQGETVSYGYFRQDGLNVDESKKVLEVITDISEKITMGGGHEITPMQYLNHFMFPPAMHNVLVSKLSGGEKRRLYLMTVLMKNPNFLILDEPTNDLDILTLDILEDYLADFQGCLIVVSHDRYFMDRIVDHLFVFQGDGLIKDFPGNYTQYRTQQVAQEKAEKKREKVTSAPRIKETNATKQKLTFKEKREFEQIEQEISKLEEEKSDIEDFLNSGSTDSEELTEKSIRIQKIMDLLEEKEMRWLELSELA